MPEVDVERVLEISEKISNVVGSLLSALLIVQVMGDLLGINIFQLLKTAVSRPWVIPTEWIVAYYPLWYAMECVLLVLMVADQVITMRYLHVRKAPPPPSYARWLSFSIFMLSFWLALIFRYMTFTLITIFAAISFSYTMFIRKT